MLRLEVRLDLLGKFLLRDGPSLERPGRNGGEEEEGRGGREKRSQTPLIPTHICIRLPHAI